MRTFHLLVAALCAAPATLVAAQDAEQELKDLIPESAVDDPESWAAQGVEDAPAAEAPTDEAPIEATEPAALDAPLEPLPVETVTEAQPDRLDEIDGQFGEVPRLAIPEDVPIPERLERDEEVRAAAIAIDAPDLVEALPDLAETQISNELVLAFPVDEALFPEKRDFTARFAALSNIETLKAESDTFPQIAARARADEELLQETLRTYGYYDAEVLRQFSGGRRDRETEGSRSDRDPRIRFDIIPGTRYAFGAIDLGALDALPEPDGSDLRGVFGIEPGDPLYADRIIEQRAELDLALGESGYPFAAIAEPELYIDHEREEGDLTMEVSPNGRYVFGSVVSEQPEFLSGEHLGMIARFEQGETYQRSLETDLGRAVLSTGLVSSVTTNPRIVTEPQGDQPGEIALDVGFERAPLRTIAGAIGYGTEEGARIEASWEHRNLFPPEGALRLRGILGTREQLASVAFLRNNFLARDQSLTVEAYAFDLDTEAIEARSVGLRGTFERTSNQLFIKPLSWQVGAEVLWSDERNATFVANAPPREEYLIGGLFARATLDTTKDLLDPREGFRLTGTLAPDVSQNQGVTSFYLRSGIDARYYQPLGNVVVAGRANFLTITGAPADQIAPSRRLYAGGGGSVRGYAFQAIGPRDQAGEPIGGRSLVEFSLEARIDTGFFDGALQVVPFVDAGSVSTQSTPDLGVIRVGAGVGIRYKTSFGPIRVDVGAPLNPDEFDNPVAVYVSLGQAF
ncbi:MAG: BamA/TamA family outer membrane protein [Pseudomonadota bacterium]